MDELCPHRFVLSEEGREIGILKVARAFRELDFEKLMEVYREANEESGRALAPYDSYEEQLRQAEADFYDYLREAFFDVRDAVYYIYEANGRYVSALRLEPYKDGLLLEGLETASNLRRKGYGHRLVQDVVDYIASNGGGILYSHIAKKNIASRKLHEKACFIHTMDYAEYIDGSVNRRADTYKLIIPANEKK